MGCNENDTKSSGCQKDCSTGCEMTDMLMKMADKAWEELMVEKVKGVMQEMNGARMDRVARASVESASAYWEHHMQGKQQCGQAKEKIKQAFMG